MKIRKALAVVLSLAMTVTLMPATAFAATKNTANTPVTVADEDAIPMSYVEMEVSNATGITTPVTVTFNLDNAKWIKTPKLTGTGVNATVTGDGLAEAKLTLDAGVTGEGDPAMDIFTLTIPTGYEFDGDPEFTRLDDDTLTVTFTTTDGGAPATAALAKEDTITATFAEGALVADGDEGEEITVEVDPADAKISAGTYTIATIAGGGTTATVSGSVKAYATRTDGVEAAEVTIKETTSTAIADGSIHVLKMQLPKGVEWDETTPLKITGGLIVAPGAFDIDADGTTYTSTTKLLTDAKANYTIAANVANTAYTALGYLANDKRTLYVAVVAHGTPARQSAYIVPVVDITKNASEGEVTLTISDTTKNPTGTPEFSAASGLVIAKVGEEGVTIATVDDDELPTIVTGQVTDTDDEYFWTEVKLTESVAESLTLGKGVDFEFEDGVQVVTDAIDATAGVRVSLDKNDDLDDASTATLLDDTATKLHIDYDDGKGLGDDTSSFSIDLPKNAVAGTYGGKTWSATKGNTMIVFIPVTVAADNTGDVTVKVSGKDFKDTELTVAKAISPVTVETTVTNVVNGAKDQALADITVKENVPGYLGRTSTADRVYFTIDTKGIANGYALDGTSVKVTSGDLEVGDKVNYNGDYMWVEIDDASTEASTFVLSGVVINLSRTLAEGAYDLELAGVVSNGYTYNDENVKNYNNANAFVGYDTNGVYDGNKNAVVENQFYNDGAFGAKDEVNAAATPYINITTAADTVQTGIVANFYLDGSKNSTYTVNGVDATMDAAAYLDSNNRTMVPIRYVAYALGLTDSDISYSTGDSTATLSGLTNVVKVTTGSNVLQASNGNVTMDTVAVNNGGRLYVPARFIAQAMSAQVAWDQATKTVTITK